MPGFPADPPVTKIGKSPVNEGNQEQLDNYKNEMRTGHIVYLNI